MMENCDHRNLLGIQDEISGVRKPTQNRIPDSGFGFWDCNGSRSTAASAIRTTRANSSPSPAFQLSYH
jgi:hypothetical protein